ncbi:protein tramtrack, beta isoform isoform X14 [Eurytemora carolleeae]|uniref:protein tramtrack, beta isoform isoform X14 n=1 Tax=Eurytemora carolleeae TaxID=1294199 RepID=UPI000C757DAE|nr:protein tramtrack, beta isoform isoform X14 [Eurytemora carolleeae]|eukprot:XP_023319873.1 protein tramtrack, beta isoform-like isoform X14 [Eurytemora affinis]
MGTSEKFCLRWNDFETNISVAFRELREEKDFFDVTLACDDSSQIQAHKVILSACSPFFRNVLRKNPHQHPLLYLKGVKYKEMLSVLNFMYMGEVNVAQEELNSFLAVAEDLRVKGLTQNNAESGDKTKAESKSNSNRNREPPEREPGPPPKRARPVPSAPSTPAPTNNRPSSYEDDDIQEVVPVKSEPRDVTTPSTAMTTSSNNDYQDSSLVEPGQGQVALEDSYQDDSYDYGNYEEGYDDGSGMIDPNTGMPIAAGADGNKEYMDSVVSSKIFKSPEGVFHCTDCDYSSRWENCLKIHIESKHVRTGGFSCSLCEKVCPTRNALKVHCQRRHKPDLPTHVYHA